ncbi:sensor histidine kinase, partial [Clostridium sp.]|uniref:sensor histidine kinase n=1 Tax=Clostridium sp. TaxID=1506 RepID=UPI00261E847E
MRYVSRAEEIIISIKSLINKDYAYNNGMLEEIVSAKKVICEQNNEIEKLKEFIRKQDNEITTEVNSNIIMKKALKSQEEFIVNISHELKTPLNVLSAAVQLFSIYCSNGSLDKMKSSIIKYIGSMKQNCYRLSKLINNIVDSS